MLPFLKQVSGDLLARFGNDMSRVTVVLPSRRARLFISDYLVQAADTPIWAPQYTDMNGLFAVASPLQIADPLKLVAELYRCYCTRIYQKENAETLDTFYFFGEMLLADFNDVDKCLVDADLLFSNMDDLEQFNDRFEHLDPTQWEIIHRFFRDIRTDNTPLKEAFYSIWKELGRIYHDFRAALVTQQLAYEGMQMRDALSRMEVSLDAFTQNTYVFVGFHLLTAVEQRLMTLLKNKALFYWDYDNYYLANKNQEAGRFLRDNLARFPQALPLDADALAKNTRQITIVAAPSRTAQLGYMASWIDELGKTQYDDPDTAVVLCDEQLLPAAIHALPQKVDCVNITMGFNLMQTPVAGLVSLLLAMQQKGIRNNTFRYTYLLPLLRHSYVRLIYPQAAQREREAVQQKRFFISPEELDNHLLFQTVENSAELATYLLAIIEMTGRELGRQDATSLSVDNLQVEAVFRVYQMLSRLRDIIRQGDLEIEIPTFIRLLKRLLATTTVPFHGEPARGLQLMGMLETRNMDFKNLILVSVNEGIMPKVNHGASFIPHFIRRHFGMHTAEHQDALYAYSFYRLLQRAERATFVYNTSGGQTGKAEISRFLLQLLTEYPFPEAITRIAVKTELLPRTANIPTITKTDALMQRLREAYNVMNDAKGHSLSPSALNIYIDCPLQFYFKYLAEIVPPDELSDELDNSVLGSVFHKAAECIYRLVGHLPPVQKATFAPFEVTAEKIDFYLKNHSQIERVVELAFNEVYFHRPTARNSYNGEQLIYFNVVCALIVRLLKIDKTCAPFLVTGLEAPNYRRIKLDDTLEINIGGIVDRIDLKENILRVVDYKTSASAHDDVNTMAALFEASGRRSCYTLQAFLYASTLLSQHRAAIAPTLLYITKATDTESYSPAIHFNHEPVHDFSLLAEEFEAHLIEKLRELFDPTIAFTPQPDPDLCSYCDFKTICGR
ncbi:MAG: PD-(D/E)XK nuclease family protein [Prevotellaceae bacterium]|jgi:hypothetical protein|nr:PD-(D/E)XK nuclease family protein [Prevotellaceae bacterium]